MNFQNIYKYVNFQNLLFMREAIIQEKIKNILEVNGWYVLKLIQTNKNGIPDLLVMKNGQVAFIEVKNETGKLSELQRYRIEELKKRGIKALVANNHIDIINLLENAN